MENVPDKYTNHVEYSYTIDLASVFSYWSFFNRFEKKIMIFSNPKTLFETK